VAVGADIVAADVAAAVFGSVMPVAAVVRAVAVVMRVAVVVTAAENRAQSRRPASIDTQSMAFG
jgi:hypothetical protein